MPVAFFNCTGLQRLHQAGHGLIQLLLGRTHCFKAARLQHRTLDLAALLLGHTVCARLLSCVHHAVFSSIQLIHTKGSNQITHALIA